MASLELPTLSHFRNRNGWLGSVGLLRYQIETPLELPDQDDIPLEDRALTAQVVLWQGPFSRPYAQELGRETFPITPEGLEALRNYLSQWADQMAQSPTYTPEETTAYYLAQKAQEEAPGEERPK